MTVSPGLRLLRRRLAPLPSLLLWFLLQVSPAAAAPSLEAYGRLPTIERAALSPDGTRIALVVNSGDQHMVEIMKFDPVKLLGAIRIGEEKLRRIEWADETHVLLTTAWTGMPIGLTGVRHEWNLLLSYDLSTNKIASLLGHVYDEARTMNVVLRRPLVRRTGQETFLYVHGLFVESQTELALFRVNLTNGGERLMLKGGVSTEGWILDDTGTAVAEAQYVEHERRWEIRLLRNGRTFQKVSGLAPIEAPEMLGLTADGRSIVTAVADDSRVSWKTLSLEDGSFGPDLAPGEALTDLIFDRGSERMIGTAFVGDTARYSFVDPQLQQNWEWAVRVFRGDRVELVSLSDDHSELLVRVLGPRSGYRYAIADLKEHRIIPVSDVYAQVGQIAEVRPISYPAADGLHIPAYLTLPPGREAKNLPVIVMPHGGPEVRDRLDFDWWAQALASQGYAVLQPNYRGSDLNRKWVEAGFGEFGRKMQTDLSDGLRYLAQQGIVDPGRACIVGASYGGYAALAGVTLQSGVYRCAVAVAGISDPGAFLAWVQSKESYGDRRGLRYWDRFLAVDGPRDKRLDEISPLKHFDGVSVPVMLIHGRDDTIVPYDQSTDMCKALQRAGKEVTLVSLDKEDHYLSRSPTRLQMLKASVEFLQRYNPPQ